MIASDALRALAPGRAVAGVWLTAALVAGSLHIGAAGVAAWTLSADDTFDDEGAPAIELAMDMAAPKTEQTDLPPGPEADASAAAPESAQSAAKMEATDRPKEEVVEAENPDRIVAVEEPKKPEEKAEEQQRRSEASTASIASEATAAPRQGAAPPAPDARAPVIGAGQNAQKMKAEWTKRLFAHLSRHKRYPQGVRQRQAEARVLFTLDRAGHVVTAQVSKTAGDTAFDGAALDMMKRSDPVPAPPPLVADEGLTFEIPVAFRPAAANAGR